MVLLQATFLISYGNNIVTSNFALFVANDVNFELATIIKTKNKCFFFFQIELILFNNNKKNTALIVGEILNNWVINITGY